MVSVYMLYNSKNQTVMKDEKKVGFDNALIEGEDLTVNKKGEKIYFLHSGFYRITFNGYLFPFSHTEMTLKFFSKDTEKEFHNLCKMIIPYQSGYIMVNFDTVIEVKKGQVYRLIIDTNKEENVNIMADCRLIIARIK